MRIAFSSIEDSLLSAEVRLALVQSVNTDDDTLSVVMGGETYPSVPVFFHCAAGGELRENGALAGSASAFKPYDIAMVLKAGTLLRAIGKPGELPACVTRQVRIAFPTLDGRWQVVDELLQPVEVRDVITAQTNLAESGAPAAGGRVSFALTSGSYGDISIDGTPVWQTAGNFIYPQPLVLEYEAGSREYLAFIWEGEYGSYLTQRYWLASSREPTELLAANGLLTDGTQTYAGSFSACAMPLTDTPASLADTAVHWRAVRFDYLSGVYTMRLSLRIGTAAPVNRFVEGTEQGRFTFGGGVWCYHNPVTFTEEGS